MCPYKIFFVINFLYSFIFKINIYIYYIHIQNSISSDLLNHSESNNDEDAKQLNEDLDQVLKCLIEFEFYLAKQNALSDQVETLSKQQNDFEQFKKSFNMKLPFINDIINKTNEYCEKTTKQLVREDLTNKVNDANLKFKQVGRKRKILKII